MTDNTPEMTRDPLNNNESEVAVNELAGKSIILNSCNLYTAHTSVRRSTTISGTYFIWSNEVLNDRVMITNDESLVGVEGQTSGWINYSDIKDQIEESKDDEVDSVEETTETEDSDQELDLEDSETPEETPDVIEEDTCDTSNEVFDSEVSISPDTLREGDQVKIISTAKKWVTGKSIPDWVKMRTLYVRSDVSKNDTCQVSTLKSGHVTGVIEVKYLQKL